MEIIIKKPSWRDARQVSRQIRIHNQKNPNMLERMPRDIKNSNFWIARNFANQIIGSVGFLDWDTDGIEIVSHLTSRDFRNHGIGKKLLLHTLREAEKINSRIFLFTTEVEYYKLFGFEISKAENFPEKIRTHCQNCPKGSNGPGSLTCPEIAMIFKGDLKTMAEKKIPKGNTYMFC